ncbi:MAG: bifunctional nuclease family protein [Planctomycetota bacterium]|nr:bifunctional nuclease family protein [Planctomycetota bacterium]
MIQVFLSRLLLMDNQPQQVISLQETEGEKRSLQMVIGSHEAQELNRILHKQETPRPLTHELASQVMKELGGTLQQAVIHDYQEGTFFAELHIEQNGEAVKVDCRPSDALSLSLRCRAPIFATPEVMDSQGQTEAP